MKIYMNVDDEYTSINKNAYTRHDALKARVVARLENLRPNYKTTRSEE
jgi:hypothetical protein